MIDYVMLELLPEVGRAWETHPVLDFFTPTNLQTGEVEGCNEATHRHLTFQTFPSGRTIISGSLHKYWHGQHNGGAFPTWAVREAVTDLAAFARFSPEQAALHSVEFGLNVSMPSPATELLHQAVFYGHRLFETDYHGGHGHSIRAVAQQYRFKLYDKALQLRAEDIPIAAHLLRIELKIRRMVWLRKTGIVTLADLTHTATLTTLGQLLAKAFQPILFGAMEVPEGLPATAHKLLSAGGNSRYWHSLYKNQPESFRKNRLRYQQLFAAHVAAPLVEAAANGLVVGWQQLLTATPPIPELTSLIRPLVPELTGLAPTAANTGIPGFNCLGIGIEVGDVTAPPAVRRCQTCGRDISQQIARSRFCSVILYGTEGKRCRNADSNPRNNLKYSLRQASQRTLLQELAPYIETADTTQHFVLAYAISKMQQQVLQPENSAVML